jgi:hypothetical protein
MSQNELDVFCDLIALDHGIVHPTISKRSPTEQAHSIDEALASLTPEEARKCKRKFRKVLRKTSSKEKILMMSSRQKRNKVNLHLMLKAWLLVKDMNPVDNDD